MNNPSKERRAHPRYRAKGTADLVSSDGVLHLEIENISVGGVLLCGRSIEIDAGADVFASLDLGISDDGSRQVATLDGRVVRTEDDEKIALEWNEKTGPIRQLVEFAAASGSLE